MKIGFDVNGVLNEAINNRLLNSKDPGNTEMGMQLIKFANKYGMFGMDAIMFVTDLLNTLINIDPTKEDKK